jgi:hypothetical protein
MTCLFKLQQPQYRKFCSKEQLFQKFQFQIWNCWFWCESIVENVGKMKPVVLQDLQSLPAAGPIEGILFFLHTVILP